MAVKGPNAMTEAQSNQIPPALRLFAHEHCFGVETIYRYRDHNESAGRGWYIVASSISTSDLPDGFETRRVSPGTSGMVKCQIREV
jgi:hypothetical protein